MKTMNLVKVTDLTKFRQTLRFDRTTYRDEYKENGKFDAKDEFGKSDGFHEISPDVKIQVNDLQG